MSMIPVKVERVPTRVASNEVIIVQREEFLSFVKSGLKPDQDFQKIPGIDKPILTKAGAEKLCKYFGLFPRLAMVEKTEIWGGEELQSYGAVHGFFRYKYRCDIIWPMAQADGGIQEVVVANCFGQCNSKETKYAYRWIEESKLTSMQKKAAEADGYVTDDKGAWVPDFKLSADEKKLAENWEKERRKAKSGKMFTWYMNPNIKKIRVPNESIADQINTIDKMAQKRAFVGGTTLATNASDLYTVDLEDTMPVVITKDKKEEEKPTESKAEKPSESPEIQEAEFHPEPEDEAPQRSPDDKQWRSEIMAKFKKLTGEWTGDRLKAECKRCFGKEMAGTAGMTNEDLETFVAFIEGKDVAQKAMEEDKPDPSEPNSDQMDDLKLATERLGEAVVLKMAKTLFNQDDVLNLKKDQITSLLDSLSRKEARKSEEELPKFDDEGEEIKWVTCTGKTCKAKIRWGKNKKTGGPHPYNPDGTSHFSTCPNAPDFRKSKANTQKKEPVK